MVDYPLFIDSSVTSESIASKLLPFFEPLSYSDARLAQRAVAYLILLDNVKLYDETVILFECKDSIKDFLRPVKSLITDSYISRNIWRSLLYSYKENFSIENSSLKFDVHPFDSYFCWEGLALRDKEYFIEFSKDFQFTLEPLPKKELNSLMSRLYKFCKSISYRKLRFVHTADHAVLMEDIYSELQLKALKMVRHYEHLSKDNKHDIVKIENYVKQGITNHVNNLINFYTTQKRSRISNITKACETCEFCLQNQPTKCRYVSQEYQVTTLSYDPVKSKSDNSFGFSEILASETPSPYTVLEEKEFLSKIKDNLDTEVSDFLSILLDKSTPSSFENWAQQEKNIKVDDVLDSRKIVNLAVDYLNLNKKDTKNTISKQYSKLMLK